MKKFYLLLSFSLLSLAVYGQVGINAHDPNESAALEVRSDDKGLLIPRLALTSKNTSAPLSAHVAGMLVYNTATAGTAPNNVRPGFYYNDGNGWVQIPSVVGTDASRDAWIDDPANNMVKLGSKSNGEDRSETTEVVIKDNAFVGIGTTDPIAKLDILVDNQGNLAHNNFIFRGYGNSKEPAIILLSANGSHATPENLSNGNILGSIYFSGIWAGGLHFTSASAIHAFYRGNGTTQKSDLIFQTSGVDRVRIDDSGKVGIGVSTPRSTLEIEGSLAATYTFITSATSLDATHHFVTAGGTTGGYMVTLPTPSTCKGRSYRLRVEVSGGINISSYKALDGTSKTAVASNRSITLVSTGIQWLEF